MKIITILALLFALIATMGSTCGKARAYRDTESPPYQKRRDRPNHEAETEAKKDATSWRTSMPEYSPKPKK